MALKDCIKKFQDAGVPIGSADIKKLEGFIEQGMSDTEAVRALKVEFDNKVVNIISAAKDRGATISTKSDILGEVRSFATAEEKKLRTRLAEIQKLSNNESDLSQTIDDINWVEGIFKNWEPGGASIDIYNDQELMTRINEMYFHPATGDLLRNGKLVSGLIKGKTQQQIFDNFRAIQDKRDQLRKTLMDLMVEGTEITTRLMEMNLRKGEEKLEYFQQSPIGFTSGVLTAAQTMPNERGPANEMLALLKKQPGVTQVRKPKFDEDGNPILDVLPAKKLRVKGGDRTSDVLQNPTPAQVKAFRQSIRMEYKENGLSLGNDPLTRTTWDTKGNKWIWASGQAVHTVMEEDLARVLKVKPAGLSQHNEGAVAKQAIETTFPEVDWLGIEDWLKAEGTGIVSRDEIIAFAINNGIEVEETQYGGEMPQTPSLIAEPSGEGTFETLGIDPRGNELVFDYADENSPHTFTVVLDEDAGNVRVTPDDGKTWLDVDEKISIYGERSDQTMLEAEDAINTYILTESGKGFAGPAMNSGGSSVMPGGTNQREILLRTPRVDGAPDLFRFSGKLTLPPGVVMTDEIVDDMITEMPAALGTTGEVDVFRNTDAEGNITATFENLPESDFDEFVNAAIRLGVSVSDIEDNSKALKARVGKDFTAGQGRQMENWINGHYNEPNVIVHLRVNDRIGPNGEKIFHIEEIQSDWHQTGSKTEYRPGDRTVPPPKFTIANATEEARATGKYTIADNAADTFQVRGPGYSSGHFETYEMALLEAWQQYDYLGSVPDGPFKGNAWVNLALKRAIRLAAEGGYDQITWTTGATQVVRNSQIDEDGKPTKSGRGSISFYDKTLPRLLNKVIKKLDRNASARAENMTSIVVSDGAPHSHRLIKNDRAYGISGQTLGWYVVDNTGRVTNGPFESESAAKGIAGKRNNDLAEVHVMDLTDQMRETALEGQTYYQKKKGSITFDEVRKGTMRLFEARDLSTFLHESGHLYLEIMGTLAEREGASEGIKADYAKMLEFLGVENRAQITVEHHEKWATSFEKYLEEGNAPSIALQDAFNSFRRWLGEIWKRMKQSPDSIKLNEEIRGVMDRILASDEQIAEARAATELQQTWLNAEAMGVSDEVFAVYKLSLVRANNDEVEKQTIKALAAAKRDAMAWWRDEKKKVRAQVEAEAHEARVYLALAFLQKGTKPDGSPLPTAPFKLSKADLIERYGKAFMARLPRPFVYTVEGGVDADLAATALGYKSANEMIEDLIKVPKMKDWIRAETESRMQQLYPDPLVDGTMAEDAVRVVHNDRRASVLAAEMRRLRELMAADRAIVSAHKKADKKALTASRDSNKASLPKREELAIIKQAAKATIGAKKIKDVQPNVYLNAERKAGRRAFELVGQRNYEAAYIEKRKQIVNYEMYRAAQRAKDKSVKIRNYMTKFSKPRVQQRLGKLGVLDRILAVLENVEFTKKTLKAVNLEESLKQLREAVESGAMVVTPETAEKIFSDTVNWQELTVDDLQGLLDMVKQLEKEADRQLKMPVNGEMVVLEEAVDEVVQQVLENNKKVDLQKGTKTPKQQRAKEGASLISSWLGPSVLARLLDGEGWGAITRLMVVNIRRAYAERLMPMTHKALEDVTELWVKHYSNAERRRMDKKDFAVVGREQMSRNDVLSLALNMGNDGNTTALLNGVDENGQVAYPEADVRAAIAKLDSRDWLFVQDMWDYIGSYWPMLSQAMKERRGVTAEKVEPTAFTVVGSDGVEVHMKGGYYPLSYNPEFSDQVKADIFNDHYTNMGNGVFVSATTRAGATFNRVKNHNNVVALGVFQIDKHLKEIIRDIAIGNEINFVKNLLNDKAVRSAFRKTNNLAALNQLNLWLTDAAVGELPANSVIERRIAYIRVGFTKSKLAYNIYTTALQLTGAFQSAAVIGSEAMARGVGMLMRHPVAGWKEAMSKSKFLQVRYGAENAFDKDVQDTANFLQKNFGGGIPTTAKLVMDKISRSFFWPIARMQSLVDVSTWHGAYWKGRNKEGLSDAEAILYADAQVELGQTSGFFSDRSGIERGTLSTSTRQQQFIRLWTTLISYMLRKGGIAYLKHQEFKKDVSFINAVKYATDLLMLFTLEGLASSLIYGNWPDEDDDKPIAQFALEQTVLSVLSGIPFARETATAVYGGGNTPVGGLANDLSDLYIQALQGEPDAALREAFVKSFGTMFHVPASQTNRMLEALIDEDDPELLEYFTGTRD